MFGLFPCKISAMKKKKKRFYAAYGEELSNTLKISLLPQPLHCTKKMQETADLVTFTEEILNGKLHFLCSATCQNLTYIEAGNRKGYLQYLQENTCVGMPF